MIYPQVRAQMASTMLPLSCWAKGRGLQRLSLSLSLSLSGTEALCRSTSPCTPVGMASGRGALFLIGVRFMYLKYNLAPVR